MLHSAAEKTGYTLGQVELLRPPDPELGDLSSPVGLRLAREAHKAPGVIAKQFAEAIHRWSTGHLIGGVEAHPSGFVNFRLTGTLFAYRAPTIPRGGAGQGGDGPRAVELDAPGRSRRVAIEHTNVNPNKALHVGHARNLVLGDSLVRMMKKLGTTSRPSTTSTTRAPRWPTSSSGSSSWASPTRPPPGVKFDAYCGDVGVHQGEQTYEKDPSLKEKQRLVLRR